MRIAANEAVELIQLLEDGNVEAVIDQIEKFLPANHDPKPGEKVQYRSHKATGWSDEVEVVAVFDDSDGDEVMLFSYTKPNGEKGTSTRLLKDVQVRIAQPRRTRNSEKGKAKKAAAAKAETNGAESAATDAVNA